MIQKTRMSLKLETSDANHGGIFLTTSLSDRRFIEIYAFLSSLQVYKQGYKVLLTSIQSILICKGLRNKITPVKMN